MKTFTITEDDLIDAVREAWSAGWNGGYKIGRMRGKDDGWQRIESVPDNTLIDIWTGYERRSVVKKKDKWFLYYHIHDQLEEIIGDDFAITHWRYPPDPPNN